MYGIMVLGLFSTHLNIFGLCELDKNGDVLVLDLYRMIRRLPSVTSGVEPPLWPLVVS